MKIVAFEFSTDRRTVAGWDSQSAAFAQALQTDGQHTEVFTLLDQVLADLAWKKSDVQAMAVGLGPGSYTGIRLAIAAAQGWQLGRDVPLHGVSSLEALGFELWEENQRGSVEVVIDAQRNELYLATLALEEAGPRVETALHLATLPAAREKLAQSSRVVGPEAVRLFPQAINKSPTALCVARLALKFPRVSGEQLEPVYLRETEFLKIAQQRK